jgi:hypothetical protein
MSQQQQGHRFVLKNIEVHWVKLDPNKPEDPYGDDGVAKWEMQARTTDPKQRKEWTEAGLNVKAKTDDETGQHLYWRTTLRKPAFKKDGTPNAPVKVTDGGLRPLDPNTVGNGSIVNVALFQFPYALRGKNGKITKEGLSNMLMSVQVVKHVVYTPQARDDFEAVDTEVVTAGNSQHVDGDDIGDDDIPFDRTPTTVPATPRGTAGGGVPQKPSADPNF